MTSPTEGSNTLHYSGGNNTTVSGLIGQPVRTTMLHRTTRQQKRGSNTLREIYAWLSKLQGVYNFTLLEYKKYPGIMYQLYTYQQTKKILFL